GRNNGATVWGEFLGAKLKYYLGAYDLNETDVSPLISGRVNICLLGSESGFYHSSTYYGAQDIVAVGLGAQFQKNQEVNATTGARTDLTNFIADVLGEKNLGAGGGAGGARGLSEGGGGGHAGRGGAGGTGGAGRRQGADQGWHPALAVGDDGDQRDVAQGRGVDDHRGDQREGRGDGAQARAGR